MITGSIALIFTLSSLAQFKTGSIALIFTLRSLAQFKITPSFTLRSLAQFKISCFNIMSCGIVPSTHLMCRIMGSLYPMTLASAFAGKESLSLDSSWITLCACTSSAFSTRHYKTSVLLNCGRHHHQSIDLIMSCYFGEALPACLGLRVHQAMPSYY